MLRKILGELIQVTVSSAVWGGRSNNTTRTLMVARTPYYVYIDKSFKEPILQALNHRRGVIFKPATNENALLFKDITMASTDFLDMLHHVGVRHVTIIGYGQRASVKWGLNLMKVARGVDKDCVCEYDFASHIPPPCMHWPRREVHNVAPIRHRENADEPGTYSNALNHMTLVACTNRKSIERKFGRNTQIYHWPQFPNAQLEQNCFKCIPIYGSLTIIPLRGLNHRRKPSNPIDCNYFSTDDEGTINVDVDVDVDGADGKYIRNNEKNIAIRSQILFVNLQVFQFVFIFFHCRQKIPILQC